MKNRRHRLIKELYTFLRQADARELGGLFRQLDAAEGAAKAAIQDKIDNFVTHVVPIIADIDAGFGNAEATYLLAKQMIEAGACCIQIENQVSDEKQCGHQDGKVTVPHEDFLAKIRAVRYAFLELGVDDGIIVARTDSLGAGLTKQIAVTRTPGDLGDQYNSFLDVEEVSADAWATATSSSSATASCCARSACRATCSSSAPAPAKRAACSTASPRCKTAPTCCGSKPKTAYRPDRRHGQGNPQGDPERQAGVQQQPVVQLDPELPPAGVRRMKAEGKDVSAYERSQLMSVEYDDSNWRREADERIRTFQADAAREAGIFHHLITLPTYHTAALSTDNLAKEYFGDQGMLGYVAGVQRKEIRQGIACVKHQNMSGSDIGDDHKEYFSGEAALKAFRQTQHHEPVLSASRGPATACSANCRTQLPNAATIGSGISILGSSAGLARLTRHAVRCWWIAASEPPPSRVDTASSVTGLPSFCKPSAAAAT
jgi:isocitrate lyase